VAVTAPQSGIVLGNRLSAKAWPSCRA
jgi:hypothetical protein